MSEKPASLIQTNKVDFFIVGQPKSGTTAMAQFLSEHPDVGISVPKESNHFSTDLMKESDKFNGGKQRYFTVRTPEQYMECFAHCKDKALWGDASTSYLWSVDAAKNIHDYNPDAKILIMLRNPVDFVHSLHMQYVNEGTEDVRDFNKALELESSRLRGKDIPRGTRCPSYLQYTERVRYTEQIQRYFDVFPKSQIMFIITEEFNKDNAGTVENVFKFLGVDSTFKPSFGVVHGSKAPRFVFLHRIFNSIVLKNAFQRALGPQRYEKFKDTVAKAFLKKQSRQPLDPELRADLAQRFEPEVRNVAKYIKRPDLPKLWGYRSS